MPYPPESCGPEWSGGIGGARMNFVRIPLHCARSSSANGGLL